MGQDVLAIYGAAEHNLRGVNVVIPRGKLVVFTGVSGSGKSSLAFDTIYAEGQRRYVESLSAYARQFLDRMEKPKVDHIDGLSPAISIEQKAASANPRSTVATVTEIADYLRVLFARVGTVYCPKCDLPISSQTAEQIVDRLLELPEGTRLHILAPISRGRRGSYGDLLADARRQGYVRARVDGEIVDLSGRVKLSEKQQHDVDIVVDRVVVKPEARSRLNDSVETALKVGEETLIAHVVDAGDTLYSSRFACPQCGYSLPPLTPQMFSFNSPQGMCPDCGGLGTKLVTDAGQLVADPERSLADGALRTEGTMSQRHALHIFEGLAKHYGFDLATPWEELPEPAREVVLNGTGEEQITFTYRSQRGREFTYQCRWDGLLGLARRRRPRAGRNGRAGEEAQVTRQAAERPCPTCQGTRLRPEALAVKVHGRSIAEVAALSVDHALEFMLSAHFDNSKGLIAHRLIGAISDRLRFMADVGLNYLTLDRPAPTLSGGEAQRIRLATQIGSGLTGVLYVLDEPSIGLHARDNGRLLDTLTRLRDLGNTVIVVEHDAETIRRADHVVDFGPGAGVRGGQIVHSGSVEGLLQSERSLTGQYLAGRREIVTPTVRRVARDDHYLRVQGAAQHNLKEVDVAIPLGTLTCVTGVSGSGKSTLVEEIIHKALQRHLYGSLTQPGRYVRMEGLEFIDKVINIDQEPIGRTPRSNPATYVGLFGPVRELFAMTPQARVRGYEPGRFSFNVKGGRCEECEGEGTKRVEMHFLPDVYVTCEACRGTRYNRETLQIRYKGLNIAEVLQFTVAEALEHLGTVPKLRRMLQTLEAVGLDYVQLGQPAPTLSGGEAQRVKLAKQLSRVQSGDTLYILDEPTTGLHFADVEKLLSVLDQLVGMGNTVLIIEHNLDVIKCADHLLDLGPEGGEAGGRLVAAGTPEEVAACERSHTGRVLREVVGVTPRPRRAAARPSPKGPGATKRPTPQKPRAKAKPRARAKA